MNQTFSLVIPAYNEQESIEDTLTTILEAAPRIQETTGVEEIEVIVVNDGSSDSTTHKVLPFTEREGKGISVRLVDHSVNRGYGAALKTGFGVSHGNWLGFMDADGTCGPMKAERGR